MKYNDNPMPGKLRRIFCHWNLRTYFFWATADKACQTQTVLSEANTVTVESVKRSDVKKDIKYSQAINHVDTGPVSSQVQSLMREAQVIETQLTAG
jgi:hypothetical protein